MFFFGIKNIVSIKYFCMNEKVFFDLNNNKQ